MVNGRVSRAWGLLTNEMGLRRDELILHANSLLARTLRGGETDGAAAITAAWRQECAARLENAHLEFIFVGA